MVKRLIRQAGGLVIRSDNAAYPDIADYDPALLMVIGRVLWCGRRL
jgi:phage repressor protein C with HTH and peptisase S24 domain